VTAFENVLPDLTAEGDSLDAIVAGLAPEAWARPTPAPGWTIAHQIAHLTAVFRMATLAAAKPDDFTALVARIGDDFDGAVRQALAEHLALAPADLLERWRDSRRVAGEALAAVPPGTTVPWLVSPLPPAILACAGMMELFAHGQDIADALGVRREPTARLEHLVAFAARTRDFGYQARGMTPPEEPFRFEITAPDGTLWTAGPAEATQRVLGPALDFCLLVTRRRHRADLAVRAEGKLADEWLGIAQAYRGPAGEGRRPGQFALAHR